MNRNTSAADIRGHVTYIGPYILWKVYLNMRRKCHTMDDKQALLLWALF
jgi:hypothetical protein